MWCDESTLCECSINKAYRCPESVPNDPTTFRKQQNTLRVRWFVNPLLYGFGDLVFLPNTLSLKKYIWNFMDQFESSLENTETNIFLQGGVLGHTAIIVKKIAVELTSIRLAW